MLGKLGIQKSYTQVKIRLPLPTFLPIFSPPTIKRWPGPCLRINDKGSKIRTGPLLVVGTVIIKAVRSELGHYSIV